MSSALFGFDTCSTFSLLEGAALALTGIVERGNVFFISPGFCFFSDVLWFFFELSVHVSPFLLFLVFWSPDLPHLFRTNKRPSQELVGNQRSARTSWLAMEHLGVGFLGHGQEKTEYPPSKVGLQMMKIMGKIWKHHHQN